MKKKMNSSKKQFRPMLGLRVHIQRDNLSMHLSVNMRWLTAALAAFGLLLGSEPLSRLLEAVTRLLH